MIKVTRKEGESVLDFVNRIRTEQLKNNRKEYKGNKKK
jgi:hypothetical protein